MTLLPINALLIGLVALTAISVMIYWHCITKGSWKHEPAGRSLMILLLVISVITANASLNIFIPKYIGKVAVYFGLYIVMQAALIGIGFTIRSEMRRGKDKLTKLDGTDQHSK
jgi:hypothetical protein